MHALDKKLVVIEVLSKVQEVSTMICPGCNSGSEMAYSVLSNGFICLETGCSFELEMDLVQAQEVLEPEEELVCC